MKQVRQKLTLDRPATYQIKVPGHLDQRWSDWDGKITITIDSDVDGLPVTTLSGSFDQAAEIREILEELVSKGIEIVREPKEAPYGIVAVFKDLYGNLWDLLQLNSNHPISKCIA